MAAASALFLLPGSAVVLLWPEGERACEGGAWRALLEASSIALVDLVPAGERGPLGGFWGRWCTRGRGEAVRPARSLIVALSVLCSLHDFKKLLTDKILQNKIS